MASGSVLPAPGVWSWSYAGGAFPVHVAPDGRFLCPQYPADSKWQCAGAAAVQIAWGTFGNYSMAVSPDGVQMQGCYTGYPAGPPSSARTPPRARESPGTGHPEQMRQRHLRVLPPLKGHVYVTISGLWKKLVGL